MNPDETRADTPEAPEAPSNASTSLKKVKQGLLPSATRHLVDGETITVGEHSSIRKVVYSTTDGPAIPGGLNTAAARVDYARFTIKTPSGVERLDNEAIRALCASASPSDEVVENAFVIFDCDTGLFSDCKCAEATIDHWVAPSRSEDCIHNAVLSAATRTMVIDETSFFILPSVTEDKADCSTVVKIHCRALFSRLRIRPPHATQLIKDWPSYSQELDEVRYLEFCRDDAAPSIWCEDAFLFSSIGSRLDSRTAALLSLVTFSFNLNGERYIETATIGLSDINPYLEIALQHLGSGTEAYLFLPREQPKIDLVAYLRPNIWKPDSALLLPERVRRSRHHTLPVEECRPGAYGVQPASPELRRMTQVRERLVFKHLKIQAVHLLPDLRSEIYAEPEAKTAATTPASADSGESIADSDAIDESTIPQELEVNEVNSSSDSDFTEDERPHSAHEAIVEFLTYTKDLANSLYNQRCYYDALRLYIYGLKNIESTDSNKQYEPKRGGVIARLRRSFERNTMLSLTQLGEYRHALHIGQINLLTRYPDDPTILLWVARCEMQLSQYPQADAHLQQALNSSSNSVDQQQINKMRKQVQREWSKNSTKLVFSRDLHLYEDREREADCDRFLKNMGIRFEPLN